MIHRQPLLLIGLLGFALTTLVCLSVVRAQRVALALAVEEAVYHPERYRHGAYDGWQVVQTYPNWNRKFGPHWHVKLLHPAPGYVEPEFVGHPPQFVPGFSYAHREVQVPVSLQGEDFNGWRSLAHIVAP